MLSKDKTPAFFDTPNPSLKSKQNEKQEAPYSNSEPPSSPPHISLDKYLSENTSEDNISFEVLMHESKKKEQTKLHQSWLFEKEKLHLMVKFFSFK
jgi:protein DGCR14